MKVNLEKSLECKNDSDNIIKNDSFNNINSCNNINVSC